MREFCDVYGYAAYPGTHQRHCHDEFHPHRDAMSRSQEYRIIHWEWMERQRLLDHQVEEDRLSLQMIQHAHEDASIVDAPCFSVSGESDGDEANQTDRDQSYDQGHAEEGSRDGA